MALVGCVLPSVDQSLVDNWGGGQHRSSAASKQLADSSPRPRGHVQDFSRKSSRARVSKSLPSKPVLPPPLPTVSSSSFQFTAEPSRPLQPGSPLRPSALSPPPAPQFSQHPGPLGLGSLCFPASSLTLSGNDPADLADARGAGRPQGSSPGAQGLRSFFLIAL